MSNSSDNQNPLTDQQLDALLRDVTVPDDLKAELLSIPDQTSITKVTSSTSLQTWHVVLAASLAAIALFGSWKFWPNNNNTSPLIADTTDHSSPEATALLAEMEALESQLDYVLATSELAELESSIAQLESTQPVSLSHDEILSITYAVADQTTVELGSPRDDAIADMYKVIESFPNTRGAKIAREFIDQSTDNESERTKS